MSLLSSRPRRAAAAVVVAGAVFAGGVATSDSLPPRPNRVTYNIPPRADGSVNPDPFLASGVGIGRSVTTYWSAGIGPAALNPLAPSGTPARFIDYALLATMYPGFAPTDADKAAGVLPEGVSITEAQGLNNLARIADNLRSAGLTLQDITFLRIYLDNPPGTERADYAGWNEAYRRFVANVDLVTGLPIAAYQPIVVENATRPARSNIEVATLPVLGWLIEIEATAAYPG